MPVLTPEQLAQLKAIIQDASQAVAVATAGFDVSDDEVQRLVDGGWIDPKVVDDVVLGAFNVGRLEARGEAPGSVRAFAQARIPGLTAAEKAALDVARQRAGMFCTGLGDRWSQELGRYVVQADRDLAERTRDIIREEVARKIETRVTRSALKTELGRLTQDWGRDWDRIAATETQMAMEEGLLLSVKEDHGDDALMAKVPEPSACPDCLRLYLGADGNPKVRPASWWEGQGVNNVGRKRQDWLPVSGAMHPWCQCKLVHVPAGFEFRGAFPAWDLVPSDLSETDKSLTKALPYFLGPRGGKWKDAAHTIPWQEEAPKKPRKKESEAAQQLDWLSMMPAEVKKKAAEPEQWEIPAGAKAGIADPWEPKPADPKAKWSHPDYGGGKGEAPWEAKGWEPDLHQQDYVIVNSSAGKDSQAMLTHLVEMADRQGYPRERLVVVHADLGRAEWAGTLELARKQAEHYGLRFEVVQREKNDLIDQIDARYGTLLQRQMDTARLLGNGTITNWAQLAHATPEQVLAQIDVGPPSLSEWPAKVRAEKMIEKARMNLYGSKKVKSKAQKQEEDRAAARKALATATVRRDKWQAKIDAGSKAKAAREGLEKAQAAVEKAQAKLDEPGLAIDYKDQKLDFGEPIPWPSSNARFCTSDHKSTVVSALLTDMAEKLKAEAGLDRPVRFLNAMGIRAQESPNREKMTALSRDKDTKNQIVDRWYPIHEWHEEKVWHKILDSKVPFHKAYRLGMRRLSCVFCVYAGKEDLMIAATHNPKLFQIYLELEKKVGFEFAKGRSLESIRQEIQAKRDAGYELNELAEWVKKSLGLDLSTDMIKALLGEDDLEKPDHSAAKAAVMLEAALVKLRKQGHKVHTVVIEWKARGACLHLDTPDDSIHVDFLAYPQAYNVSFLMAAMAQHHGLGFEEHNAPHPLPGTDEHTEIHKAMPPGAGWHKTKGGWARGTGATYEWQPDVGLHEHYGAKGVPAPGEKGHRPAPERHPKAWDGRTPEQAAMAMLTEARKVWDDPEYGYIASGQGWGPFTKEDLPDLLRVPYHDGDGNELTDDQRMNAADYVVQLAAETWPHAAMGDVGAKLPERKQRKRKVADWSPEAFRGESMDIPTWVAAGFLADLLDQKHRKLRLVNVHKEEAAAFIEKHHKALPYLNPRGLMYAIGVKRGDRLVAVATAGHPTGRQLRDVDPRNVLELTRVASDGTTRNAASMLTGRLLDLLEASRRGVGKLAPGQAGPKAPALFVTYQLEHEAGTSYKALRDKGLRPVEFIPGKAEPGGARAQAGEQSLASVPKIRWEAGPSALPAKWGLLEGAEQRKMFDEPTAKEGQTVYLVSCVGQKCETAAPAAELYQSDWFKKARALAESKGGKWLILSAEHGVVEPGERLAPYETTLNKMPEAQRRAWAQRTMGELRPHLGPNDKVVVLAGAHYRKHLLPQLEQMVAEVSVPMKGMGIGQQKQWLKRQVEQAPEQPEPVPAPPEPKPAKLTVPKQLGLFKARKLHGRRRFQGFDVSIENRKGSIRHWVDKESGTEGQTKFEFPYGYIRLTEGADGDHVDVFLGPDESAASVHVIHQMKLPDFKRFDEDKVMMGFATAADAKAAYLRHYDRPDFFGSMTTMPVEEFRKKVYKRKGQIIKAQLAFAWEPTPGSKIGTERRRKPGGGYEYRDPKKVRAERRARRAALPEFETPIKASTRRPVFGAKDLAAVTAVFVNVSGGTEKKRLTPTAGDPDPEIGRKNVHAQISAHEVPKGAKALERYARLAREHGTRLMIDSGEFGRFTAEQSIPRLTQAVKDAPAKIPAAREALAAAEATGSEAQIKKAKAALNKLTGAPGALQRAKDRAAITFPKVFAAYKRVLATVPPDKVTIVAPDKIADPGETARLQKQYAAEIRELRATGVELMVPIQAKSPEQIGADYASAADLYGEGFTIGIPSAKGETPMEVWLPAMAQLYAHGRFPKVHFLGGGRPREMAERTVQLVAAAYFAGQGVAADRVVELTETPDKAARALRNIKTQDVVLDREADAALAERFRDWVRAAGGDPDDPDFDETEEWMGFYEDHPEEFNLELDSHDKPALFRKMAGDLVQMDASVVGKAQQKGFMHHPVTGTQVDQTEEIRAKHKLERHVPLLQAYLESREHQTERFAPPAMSAWTALWGTFEKSAPSAWDQLWGGPESAWEALSKASGDYMPRVRGTVQTMAGHADPARSADEVNAPGHADLVQDWPPFRDSEDDEELDELERRRKMRNKAAQGKRESMERVKGVGPGSGAKPMKGSEEYQAQIRNDKDTGEDGRRPGQLYRENLDEQQASRQKLAQGSRLTLNPKLIRRRQKQ